MTMRPARSALAYSNKLAKWAWRGSFQSIGTAPAESPHWIKVKKPQAVRHGSRQGWAMATREQKIALGQMRQMDVRGLLIYCSDYSCAHSIEVRGDPWLDHIRLA
jgi:hypothetical protein